MLTSACDVDHRRCRYCRAKRRSYSCGTTHTEITSSRASVRIVQIYARHARAESTYEDKVKKRTENGYNKDIETYDGKQKQNTRRLAMKRVQFARVLQVGIGTYLPMMPVKYDQVTSLAFEAACSLAPCLLVSVRPELLSHVNQMRRKDAMFALSTSL